MPVYTWVAETTRGKVLKGELEAVNEKVARAQLRKRRLTVKKLKPKPKDLFENIEFLQPKIKSKDIVVFTRQFSTMIDAGLPLVQGLNILAGQTANPSLRKVLKEVCKDVEGGSGLGEALAKHPKVFDELFVNLVVAGEAGGMLDTVLQRLAAYIEKAQKLKSQVKGAMTYPVVVIGIAILVTAVILIFVIPVFEDMFSSFGKALPLPTQIVIAISHFLKSNIHYIIGGLMVFGFVFKKYRNTRTGRRQTDTIALKIPLIGSLLKKSAIARFTRTLGTMIKSGVPILDALNIVAKTSGNVVLEEVILEARSSIAEGQPIAEPLAEADLFPPMVVQMISVGESTGALETMLEKVADFYEDEVDTAVAALTSMLEPILIVFLGGTIGGLVVSMYLPIFQMASIVGS